MNQTPLTTPGLEAVYDLLAANLDRVGPDKAELFLVKLALLNANAIGDADVFRQHLEAAAADL
jgi:thiamine pyrophosphokinase